MSSNPRTYSILTTEALILLGKQITLARKSRRMSEADLAARVGIARSTLQQIEKGAPKVEIGLAFEAATIVGVSLFAPDVSAITALTERTDDKLALLPGAPRRPKPEVNDDF